MPYFLFLQNFTVSRKWITEELSVPFKDAQNSSLISDDPLYFHAKKNHSSYKQSAFKAHKDGVPDSCLFCSFNILRN